MPSSDAQHTSWKEVMARRDVISLLKRRKMEAMGLLLKAGQTDFLGTYSTGNATAITSV
jgi:hypothetical protein